MRHENSLMHDVTKSIPWKRFDQSVKRHGGDRCIRTLTTRSQLIAMLHGQLSGSASLREIVTTMASHETRLYHLGATAPARSTLADANAKRPVAIFVDLFNDLVAQAHPGLRKHAKDAVRLIDATRIPLNDLSKSWARYDTRTNGVKTTIV